MKALIWAFAGCVIIVMSAACAWVMSGTKIDPDPPAISDLDAFGRAITESEDQRR